MKGEYGLLNF